MEQMVLDDPGGSTPEERQLHGLQSRLLTIYAEAP